MEPIVSVSIPQRGSGYVRHLTPRVERARWVESSHGSDTADFTVLDPAVTAVLTADCPVVLSDPRSGEVVWTGRVARNGIQISPLGESATVRCVGTTALFYQTYWSLPYITRDSYQLWERETIKYGSTEYFETRAGAKPVDPPLDSLMFTIRQGQEIVPQIQARQAYLGHMGTDMWIGGMSAWLDSSPIADPAGWRQSLYVGDQFYNNRPIREGWDSTEELFQPKAGGTGWPMPPKPSLSDPAASTENYLVAVSSWEPVAGTPGFATEKVYWNSWHNVHVIGQRVDKYGENIPMTTIGIVWSHEIVNDLLGRCMLGVVDPSLCEVATTSFGITHADWRDPSAPGEIMDDLQMLHPDHLWRAGHPNTQDGLVPFEWRTWESTARYLVSDPAEVDLDGTPDQLFNQVTIKWVDWKGRPRTKKFRANPALYPDVASLVGIVEPPPLDLDASLGQVENVDRIGTLWLDTVARHVPAGSITVDRPVLDVTTQQLVLPSAVEAGSTVALASDEPLVVHRVQDVAHDGVDVATLSVGQPRLTLDQIVATRGRRRT